MMREEKAFRSHGQGEDAAFAVLLAALVAFQAISTDLYLPSLPSLTADLATEIGAAQLTLSSFLVGFGSGQLFWGALSDRFGRRPVLLAGLGAYLLSSLACAAASSIGLLIAFRLLQGASACAAVVLGRAVVRDLWPPQEAARVLSFLASAMAVAPMAGPVLGGWLTELWGWRANFLALALFGVLVLAGTWWRLRETNRMRDPRALEGRRLAAGCRIILTNRMFLLHTLAAAFAYSGIFTFISASSFVLIELVGLTPFLYGAAFATAAFGYMLGGFASGRLNARLGIPGLLRTGSVIALLSACAGLAWNAVAAPSFPGIVLPVFCYMFGAGFVLPAAMAGAIGPFPERAGTASALLGFLQLAIAAAIGFTVALLYDGTALPMHAVLASVALVNLAVCLPAARLHATLP